QSFLAKLRRSIQEGQGARLDGFSKTVDRRQQARRGSQFRENPRSLSYILPIGSLTRCAHICGPANSSGVIATLESTDPGDRRDQKRPIRLWRSFHGSEKFRFEIKPPCVSLLRNSTKS